MAQVLIREIDELTIANLKHRATSQGRSLEAELRIILFEASLAPSNKVAEPKAQLNYNLDSEREPGPSQTNKEIIEKLREMFAGRTFPDSVELLREDRKKQ